VEREPVNVIQLARDVVTYARHISDIPENLRPHVARYILEDAASGDINAGTFLEDFLRTDSQGFEDYFGVHLAQLSDELLRGAAEYGHPSTLDFISELALRRPDLFEKYLSGGFSGVAEKLLLRSVEGDSFAARLLRVLSNKHPRLFRKHFVDNEALVSYVENLLESNKDAEKRLHNLLSGVLLPASGNRELFEGSDTATAALLRLFHDVVHARKPLTKDLLRDISRYPEHKTLKILHRLGTARGWYLKSLLESPDLLALYLVHATRWSGGKRTYRKLYELLPLIRAARALGIKTTETTAPNIDTYRDWLERKVKNRALELLPQEVVEVIASRALHTLPSVIAYYNKHGSAVLDLLSLDEEQLFKLKFGHYGLDDRLLSLARELNESPIYATDTSMDDFIEALREEARNEGLFEKNARSEEERKFLEAVREAYREIVENREKAELHPQILEQIRNTKMARAMGLSETVNKIISFLDRRNSSKQRVRIAFYPEEHLHAMNVPGSCMRPGGVTSHGAVSITGGPALVFYAMNPAGRVNGRVSFILYEGPNGEPLLVPNANYGSVNVKKPAIELLRKKGIPVHDKIRPPKGFKPARSRFNHEKEFWKDGKGKERFR